MRLRQFDYTSLETFYEFGQKYFKSRVGSVAVFNKTKRILPSYREWVPDPFTCAMLGKKYQEPTHLNCNEVDENGNWGKDLSIPFSEIESLEWEEVLREQESWAKEEALWRKKNPPQLELNLDNPNHEPDIEYICLSYVPFYSTKELSA